MSLATLSSGSFLGVWYFRRTPRQKYQNREGDHRRVRTNASSNYAAMPALIPPAAAEIDAWSLTIRAATSSESPGATYGSRERCAYSPSPRFFPIPSNSSSTSSSTLY
jgi:hypothetical protein